MSGLSDAVKGIFDPKGWAKLPRDLGIQVKEWFGKKAWPEGTTTEYKNGYRGRVIVLMVAAAPFTMGATLLIAVAKLLVILRDK